MICIADRRQGRAAPRSPSQRQVADVIGVRALAVHAKDDRAVAFYRHFGFTPSPTDARHLFMIITDIRLAAGQKP
jgi:hypothetical protein